MDAPNASSGEMPGFFRPSRPSRELGEPLLDALLEGRSLPPDAPVELCAVAEMLADLAGPAEPGELAGEAAARLGLARTAHPAGISPAAHRSAQRRRSWVSVPGAARPGARHGLHSGRARGHTTRGEHARGKATGHAKASGKPTAAKTPPGQAKHHVPHPAQPS